jgi:hypothetical protein
VLSAAELESILEAAKWAPSAENRHAFELAGSQDGIRLYGNDAYCAAAWHHRFLAQISLGAVIENIVVRAAALGYHVTVFPFPEGGEAPLLAELLLVRAEAIDSPHNAAITTRQTNRTLLFAGPRLDASTLEDFRRLAEAIEGVSLAFLDSPERRASILPLVRLAETERFKTESLHRDLFSGVRFDVGWHATADVGIPPGALNVEPGARWLFAQLRHWPLMRALSRFGVHHALGVRAGELPCRFAPHVGLLATSLSGEGGPLAVGRALQRVWLEAESRGLALQPFAGAGLLARPEYAEVSPETGRRLRELWTRLTQDTLIMVFRLGRARRPAIRASRPTNETFRHA